MPLAKPNLNIHPYFELLSLSLIPIKLLARNINPTQQCSHMKKELMIAASLLVTHAYSRRAEALCESEIGLSEDSKKFIRQEVEEHCNFIMGLAEQATLQKKKAAIAVSRRLRSPELR